MPSTTPFISDRVNAKLRNVAERFMVWTCDTQRAGSTSEDNYTQTIEGNWTTNLTDQKCNFSIQSAVTATGEVQDRYRAMVLGRYKLEFPYGSDILITDRVVNLRDRDGNLVDPTILFFEVKELIPDDTSLSLSVEAIH